MSSRRIEFLLGLTTGFSLPQLVISFYLTKFKTSYDNMELVFKSNGAISFPAGPKLLCLHTLFTNWDRKKPFIAGPLEMCCVHMVFLAFLGLARQFMV